MLRLMSCGHRTRIFLQRKLKGRDDRFPTPPHSSVGSAEGLPPATGKVGESRQVPPLPPPPPPPAIINNDNNRTIEIS